MKKFHYLPLIILGSVFTTGHGKTLSPEEALSRLDNQLVKTRSISDANSFKQVFTVFTSQKEPSLYIFNNSGAEGFVVLSADDLAPALLGYSEHDNFNASAVPPALNYWLDQYSRQIEILRINSRFSINTRSEAIQTNLPPIAPLLKSKWNQGSPFNKYCVTISPEGQETQSVTGCVATAMAQIMYYFQYPQVGHGEISYKYADSGTYSMNFGSQNFQWSEMLPIYYPDKYTSSEEDAVAYLMKACGYSVKMDYGKGESGASGTAIAGALIEYFGYKNDIIIQTRKFQSYEDWSRMIYENLAEIGPVVYNGSALDGGHSFVCDGYDGNGYFHFNWGWGGMSDGYYLLDALNPDEFGIGGAAGGYNLGQQIILGISPDKSYNPDRQVMQFGSVTGKIDDDVLSLELTNADYSGFQYIDPEVVDLTFGIMVENQTDPSQEVQYFESEKKNLEGKQGDLYHWTEVGTSIDLSKVVMAEGDQYNFRIATLISSGGSSEWSPTCVMPGKYNYVTVIKTPEGYKLTNYKTENLTVEDFKVDSSPIYYNLPVKFSALFVNDGNSPLTRNYSAVLFNDEDKECYKMENYSVNVDAGASSALEWTSVDWYKENGAEEVTQSTQFTLKLYDNWEGAYVEGIEEKVTVLPAPTGEAKIESELTIIGAQKEGNVYLVNGNQFEATLNVKVLEGSLNHTLMLALQMPLSSGDYYTVYHKHFDSIPDLTAGEEQTFDISVLFEDARPDTVYRVEVWGPDGGFDEKIFLKFDIEDNAVDSLAPDVNGMLRIYNIDGREIYSGNNMNIIYSLPKGLYIINGNKILIP